MATEVTRPLRIVHHPASADAQPVSGAGLLHVTAYTQRDRVRRALKRWLGFWLAAVAVFLTFIPAIHLAVALALLIGGVVTGVQRLRMAESLLRVSGACPVCGASFELPLEPREHLPKWDYCPQCRVSLKLTEE